jgi:hypothetical protein|tara:strand:+ start:1074 stop:1256 length:183 start_codon:yes stop_codon:yes gene_type:complete
MARYEKTSEEQRMMDEWLAKGNSITVCEPGERTSSDDIAYTHGWGKKKKKAPEQPKDDIS